MKPYDMDNIEDQALQVGRTTREHLLTLPDTEVVWPTFVNWVNKQNKKNSVYTAPIPVGFNIIGYDMPIIRAYCKKYKTAWDEERQDQKLFSQVYKFDVLDHLWYWFENNSDVKKLKLEEILIYMGADEKTILGSHDALNDVKNTAEIAIRLLKMQRFMTELKPDGTRRLEMKNCMVKK